MNKLHTKKINIIKNDHNLSLTEDVDLDELCKKLEEIIQKPQEEIDDVVDPTSFSSEDVHGGNEATKDIEDSSNAADDGLQEQHGSASPAEEEQNDEQMSNMSEEHNNSEDESSEQDSDIDVSELEESNNSIDDSYSTQRNAREVITIDSQQYEEHKLRHAIFRALSRLAEEKTADVEEGDDEWDMNKLMRRAIDKRPLFACRLRRPREKIIVAVDTSGSCENWAELFSSVALLCAEFDLAEIYSAPNAEIVSMFDAKTKCFVYTPQHISLMNFRGRVIIFVGDIDGAEILCAASKHNKIYWLSNECRYYEFYEHSWNEVSFDDFKGDFRPFFNERQLIAALKQLSVLKPTSVRENRLRHYRFMKQNQLDEDDY